MIPKSRATNSGQAVGLPASVRPPYDKQEKKVENRNHLYILWTSDNPVTAEKMVFMYGFNSLKHGWWEKVTIIIWGASASLVSENNDIQDSIASMLEGGVTVTACKSCTEQLGITEELENMGIEVKYWGKSLTDLITAGKKLLTV